MELKAGQIVTVDWRKEPDDPAQDPQPPEPNKLRPAVVVQDTELQQRRQLVVLSIGGLS